MLTDCGLLTVPNCLAEPSNRLPILAIMIRSSLSANDGKAVKDGMRIRSKLSLVKSGTTSS